MKKDNLHSLDNTVINIMNKNSPRDSKLKHNLPKKWPLHSINLICPSCENETLTSVRKEMLDVSKQNIKELLCMS